LRHYALHDGSMNTVFVAPSTMPLSPCPPILGGVLSSPMMVCLTVPLALPPSPPACQVLVRVYEPPHPAVELSLSSTIEELLHVSLEVGSVNTGIAGHSTVPLLPWPPIIGGVLSSTMIVWLTVPLVLLHASTACQVLVLVVEPPHPSSE